MRQYNMQARSMQIFWPLLLDSLCARCENQSMKRLLIIGITLMLLAGCAPVLNREYLQEGAREFQLGHLTETPEAFKGSLFILGGVIIETKLTEKGSQVEALFVPVNASGRLRDPREYHGRFLATFDRAKGMLDPIIYRKGREITLAGTFLEVRKGKIDDMEYAYPVFEVRQIHLWDDYQDARYAMPYYPAYYSPYHYPYYYRSPYLYDPWWRPYPYWPPPPW